jgi:alpha-glucosidase (family GH31 glycosyl hydrolase)
MLDFDGIWLDMNEPSAMYEYGYGVGEVNATADPTKNIYEYIPYVPGWPNSDLISRQISVNARNYGDPNLMTVYNTKPLNPFFQSINTYNYLKSIGKRPYILSRSSVIGLGRYASHWLGDNYSDYDSMKLSLSEFSPFKCLDIL